MTYARSLDSVTLRIADHTTTPGPRLRRDGPYSGEWFRDDILHPLLSRGSFVCVHFDGCVGYGVDWISADWIDEVFGGIVRKRPVLSRLVSVAFGEPGSDESEFASCALTEMLFAGYEAETCVPDGVVWRRFIAGNSIAEIAEAARMIDYDVEQAIRAHVLTQRKAG